MLEVVDNKLSFHLSQCRVDTSNRRNFPISMMSAENPIATNPGLKVWENPNENEISESTPVDLPQVSDRASRNVHIEIPT